VEKLPTITFAIIQVFLAGLGVYVALKPQPAKRHVIIIVLFVLCGVVSVRIAVHQQISLTDQITSLTNAIRMEATNDDISKLSYQIKDGFDRVINAIHGNPPKPTAETPPPKTVPTLENTRLVQRPTMSDKPEFPYGLQVIIQSSVAIQPISIALECDGEIGDFDYFIAGQSMLMHVSKAINKNIASLKIGFPPLTPESSLIVTLYSKNQIRVIKAYKANL
jgi:hypothetical protein